MKPKSLIVIVFSMLTSVPVSATNYAHVTPAYPVEMTMKGIAGCGVFKISLDQDGNTKSIDLRASVPKAAAFKAAKKELNKWQWHNTTDKPDAAEQKILRLDY
jgi:periplasmic protein TonB